MNEILRRVAPGVRLTTPSRRVPFMVEEVDPRGVVLRVGRTGSRIRIPAECLEGVPDFLRDKGWVRIGAIHGKPCKGSLEDYLQQFTHGTSVASYVVPILERISIVQVDRRRPARVRLVEERPREK